MPKMIKVEVSKLTGVALDWAVYEAIDGLLEELRIESYPESEVLPFPSAKWLEFPGPFGEAVRWNPSSDWAQGGPLIEKYGVHLCPKESPVHRNGGPNAGWGESGFFSATIFRKGGHRRRGYYGDSMLTVACQSIVSFALGDFVEVPEDLIEVRA